jgi:hypothetical protein
MRNDKTYYSDAVKGDKGNHYWGVTYDISTVGGYLGVNQYIEGSNWREVTERVLLSKNQVKQLLKFLKAHKC